MRKEFMAASEAIMEPVEDLPPVKVSLQELEEAQELASMIVKELIERMIENGIKD